MDTQVEYENKILNFKTVNEINDYCDTLIADIENLIEKKIKKFDISGDIVDLKNKLNLLIHVKENIIEKNEKEKSINLNFIFKIIIRNYLIF